MDSWPSLVYSQWAPTKRTLHLIAQMMGKVRLALAPYQPNFIFAALYMTPRGLTTSPIPVGDRLVEIRLDVVDARLELLSSDGRRREFACARLPTITKIYDTFLAELRAIEVDVTISPIPQEVPDQTPLDRDDRPVVWADQDARAWLSVMCASQGIFDRWRAHFFGRTGVQFWWGAFDLSLVLFSGRHVEPPSDRGYLFKYDLDAQMMSAGFYPGDDANEAFYYAYIYPEPERCNDIAIQSEGVQWSDRFREWILPYDVMRRSIEPEALLQQFLSGVYNVCADVAHWDRTQHLYAPPPLRHARRMR